MIVEIFWLIGALVLVIVVIKLVKTRQQHKAASNVVFAKYTHSRLNNKQQKAVHEKAKELVLAADTKLTGFANEVERYGWYALAMKELGIASMVPENPNWYAVKNPYTAIFPGNYLIRAVSDLLKQKYNLDVHVSEKTNYAGVKKKDKS